jgi:hypothetical protein
MEATWEGGGGGMEGLIACVSVFPYRDLSNLRSMSS